MTTKRTMTWAALALAATMTACGGESSSGGGPAAEAPSAAAQAAAQQADAGASAVDGVIDVATDAVVDSGSPGATQAKSTSSAVSASAPVANSIDYQANVTVQVDLDHSGPGGSDIHPNASGRFTATAVGSIVGTEFLGQATYNVQVKWDTAGTFTDPNCGATATVAANSGFQYALVIKWVKTDDLHWSIEAKSDATASASATVVKGGKTVTVTGTAERHGTATFGRIGATFSFSFGLNGKKTVIVSEGATTHTVVITMEAVDRIFIEVDTKVYGPFTWFQVILIFGFDCKA